MPYIEAKLSCKLTAEKTEALKAGFGKAIQTIPGKSEQWLMVNIIDGQNLFFAGDADADSAYISVEIFGKASSKAYGALTSELCTLISYVTGISPSRTYITYREIDEWCWNGSNL